MLTKVRDAVINIHPNDVIEKARDHGLDVRSIEDFRDYANHYDRIEEIMEDYRSSYARISSLGGLTTGIGGFFTSVTFASLDTVSLSIQLYRLAQRFAILNGFDGSDPLQRDKMMNIYFEALGVNAVTQATLKHQLLKASAVAGSRRASDNFVIKLIIKMSKVLGKRVSSRRAGKLVPVVGGIMGATVNYSFARKTSQAMKNAYTRAYFDTWQS